ncbi:hypothetical protein E4T48_06904 [Aureobasidium sp. EXF-10727]|nr:hypothetical protein E4T48_06904 [Aureobasidium sp. EXF-10727]
MAQVVSQHQSHSSRASPASVHEHRDDAPLPAAPPPPPNNASANKKAKPKKAAADTNDAHKQLQAKIAQLEQDATGRAEEDAEIDREVKKANRDLQNLLQSMDGPISKMETVQRKYSELLAEMKRTEREHMKAKKRGDQLQKDKDTQRSELTKANSMKEKLEKLSRELTKENKKLKEDLRELKESAADKNEELHRRLERMVGDVEQVISDRKLPDRPTGEMEEDKLYASSNSRLRPALADHMCRFREKFKSFVEQYEMREIQFHSLLRSKELEIQFHLAQQERLRKQQDAELNKSHQLTRQVSTFSQTENELRSQLNIYVEKFKQQVEDTLNNSNDLFLTFRKEMEEMSKKSKRLEKENMQLTRKQEATNKNIFQMAEERTHSQQTIDRLHKENEKLKKLCRAMQTNGYGRADMVNAAPGAPNPAHHPDEDEEDDLAETDSEYDEYDEDEDEGSVEAEYDDDTEDEAVDQRPRTYGPVPPPPPPPPTGEPAHGTNGKARQPPQPVNGVKH